MDQSVPPSGSNTNDHSKSGPGAHLEVSEVQQVNSGHEETSKKSPAVKYDATFKPAHWADA
jgi:hypothetical protein